MKFTILEITGEKHVNIQNLVGKKQCQLFEGDNKKMSNVIFGKHYREEDRNSVRYGCFEAKLVRVELGPVADTAALVVMDHPNEVTIIVSTQDGPLTEAQLQLTQRQVAPAA
jgi:hypothetical protein